MPKRTDSSWSNPTPDSERVTVRYDDGSSKDVTKEADGGLTVTDHDSSGNSVTGDGYRHFGSAESLSTVERINKRS